MTTKQTVPLENQFEDSMHLLADGNAREVLFNFNLPITSRILLLSRELLFWTFSLLFDAIDSLCYFLFFSLSLGNDITFPTCTCTSAAEVLLQQLMIISTVDHKLSS